MENNCFLTINNMDFYYFYQCGKHSIKLCVIFCPVCVCYCYVPVRKLQFTVLLYTQPHS